MGLAAMELPLAILVDRWTGGSAAELRDEGGAVLSRLPSRSELAARGNASVVEAEAGDEALTSCTSAACQCEANLLVKPFSFEVSHELCISPHTHVSNFAYTAYEGQAE